ncbi:hypothetical protein EV363DRAFT_1177874 [Boletus edulis]|nr:hypothetical protein EV363DRAFT_1177874 [Boletus edulis]
MDNIHHSYSLRAYTLGIPAVVVSRSFLTILFCFVFGLVRSLSLHSKQSMEWAGRHRKINDYSCWIGSGAPSPDSWRNHCTAKQERDNTRVRLTVQTGFKRISQKKRSTNFVEAHKGPIPQHLA